MSISIRHTFSSPSVQLLEVTVCATQHPHGERVFEIRIYDCACLIEHAFNCFLRPGAVLTQKET